MTTALRFVRFNVVGGLGIGVQLVTVAVLVHGTGADPVLATAVGIGAALVHNFVWHVRWTWRDRSWTPASTRRGFARFVTANGTVSFVGSMAMIPVLIGPAGLPAVVANMVTIAVCGLANFWLAGAYMASGSNRRPIRGRPRPSPCSCRSSHARQRTANGNATRRRAGILSSQSTQRPNLPASIRARAESMPASASARICSTVRSRSSWMSASDPSA